MNIGKAIYDILSNHAGLTALVSTRIYPVAAAQQAALPYVVFDTNRTDPVNRFSGRARMQHLYLTVSAFSKDYSQCAAVAVQINEALDRVAAGTYSGVVIQGVLFENQYDGGFIDEDDVFMIPVEFKINLSTGAAA